MVYANHFRLFLENLIVTKLAVFSFFFLILIYFLYIFSFFYLFRGAPVKNKER